MDKYIQKHTGGNYSLYIDGQFMHRGRLRDIKAYMKRKGWIGRFDGFDMVNGFGFNVIVK